ncbi:MAG: bifunctional DNA primase/polymerase [Firmicutes bacterium]|nr:bifunctional DNA primase/polymerase [Bacillota bacterium]
MTNLKLAIKYLKEGWAVYPLKPQTKIPATPHGYLDATTDENQIKEWFSSASNYNVGIVTGQVKTAPGEPPKYLFVLDMDNHGDANGVDSVDKWETENGAMPPTATVLTGSGGLHRYYYSDRPVSRKTNLYPGVDILGTGGGVIAPPSIHPNGNAYVWAEDPKGIAYADDLVYKFLEGNNKPEKSPNFELKEGFIPEGQRTDTMFKLACSLQAKGLSDTAIRTAIKAENQSKCNPPLTDSELEKEVFQALQRYEKGNAHYEGMYRGTDLVSMDTVTDKEVEWLLDDYVPRNQITTIAGEGGTGKTTIWCALAAAVSRGDNAFLADDIFHFSKNIPQKVLFFSAEDSFEYTLRRKLEASGAVMENIFSMRISDEHFQDLKFGSAYLEGIVAQYKPELLIFDPIQAFVPPNIKMGDRNAMRNCLDPLIGYGEKYGCTTLLIVHANKQNGVWGRKRIADSSDIWDASRSVLMVGGTKDKGIRYLSHEKNNYGRTGTTILFSIEGDIFKIRGATVKKDKDFIQETTFEKAAPKKEVAKTFILDTLKENGEMPVKELDELARAIGISAQTYRRAKEELKADGETNIRAEGNQKGNKVFYMSLKPVI